MKTIYEKYGEYFKAKFKQDKNLEFYVVPNLEDMYCLYISSRLDFDPYFIRIDQEMVYIDGPVVQDEAFEYSSIEKISEKEILSYLDKKAKELQLFLENGVFLYAYKGSEVVMGVSIPNNNRSDFLKQFDAKKIYNENKTLDAPGYLELTRLELKDFYGNTLKAFGNKNQTEKE